MRRRPCLPLPQPRTTPRPPTPRPTSTSRPAPGRSGHRLPISGGKAPPSAPAPPRCSHEIFGRTRDRAAQTTAARSSDACFDVATTSHTPSMSFSSISFSRFTMDRFASEAGCAPPAQSQASGSSACAQDLGSRPDEHDRAQFFALFDGCRSEENAAGARSRMQEDATCFSGGLRAGSGVWLRNRRGGRGAAQEPRTPHHRFQFRATCRSADLQALPQRDSISVPPDRRPATRHSLRDVHRFRNRLGARSASAPCTRF